MPLYEYQCDRCAHRFEVIQKFSDPPVDKCPVCGGPVHKLLSAPAFQFRGTGWYITDYAKKDQGAAKPDQSSTESKTDGKGAGAGTDTAKAEKPAGESKPSGETPASAGDAGTPSKAQ